MVSNPALKTLIYENIFDFPLYRNEIWKYLISDKKISEKEFNKFLKDKRIHFDKETKLFGLTKNKKFYLNRTKSKNESLKKELIANHAIYLLSKVPTIQLIGISGSLAQFSAKENDDIDIFVLVNRGSVWTTRFLCASILKLLKMYRSDKEISNKICLNMITDQYLLGTERRDLYNAFELAQLRPKVNRNGSYEKLIRTNNWIKKYLPNVAQNFYRIETSNPNKFLSLILELSIFLGLEKFLALTQLLYMRKRTNETVTNHLLAFHPENFREQIMKKYQKQIGTTRGH